MAKQLKQLLVVSWALPPLLSARSLQVGKLLNALAEKGWQIDTICVDARSLLIAKLDRSLNHLYTDRLNLFRIREPISRLAKMVLAKFFPSMRFVPDDVDFWVKKATLVGTRLLKRKKYHAMLSFGQPWTSHIVALNLKLISDLPWLAHFSDPWIENPYLQKLNPRQQRKMLELERAVMGLADKLIFTNKPTADIEMHKYPKLWSKKVEIVPHAFDHKMLPRPASQTQKNGRMRFVYTGNLYGLRNPRNLILALERLSHADKVTLKIAGMIKNAGVYKNLAHRIGVGNSVDFVGQMTYKQSLNLAVTADVLLLIDAPGKNSLFLPSKLIDYLMLGKPILGITPKNGSAADLLRELGYSIAAPDNVDEIADAMRKFILQWQSNELKVSKKHHKVAQRYEIGHIAKQFETLINAV